MVLTSPPCGLESVSRKAGAAEIHGVCGICIPILYNAGVLVAPAFLFEKISIFVGIFAFSQHLYKKMGKEVIPIG